MAIIAIDSSGIVGQPPIFFVAVRLRHKRGMLKYDSQNHRIIRVNSELHDSFINRDQSWKLKLSAVLIYHTMIDLIFEEDVIFIDNDFPSNQVDVLRYINRLLFIYHNETPFQRRPISFISAKCNECVRIADEKTKMARDGTIEPIQNANGNILNELFGVLLRIR